MNFVDSRALYAHIDRSKDSGEIVKVQSLVDHLIAVALNAAEIGKIVGCYNICLLIGLLHDVGKAAAEFKARIMGKNKKHVDHSTAGAYFLILRIKHVSRIAIKKHYAMGLKYFELLLYPILAHHGLFDIISKCETLGGKYYSRIDDRLNLSEFKKNEFHEEILPFIENCLEPALKETTGFIIGEIVLSAIGELDTCIKKIQNINSNKVNDGSVYKIRETKLYEGYLTRLFLSILKTADCFDSSQWSADKKITKISQANSADIFAGYYHLTEKQAEYFASKVDESPLNKARVQLSDLAKEHAEVQRSGIAQMDMPTGSGKTITGLRYAIKNINKFRKSRFIYTAPFLSVVEQSAKTIKEIIGEDFVLEHHSNVVNDESDDVYDTPDETELDKALYLPKSYVQDYWDAPVIVTTMVQLYNTLFGGKAANICRFCKLIDSTIIIDEIQSLPVEHIYCFNTMLNFLSKFMKVNVILCTATQPPLHAKILDYPLYLSDCNQVIPNEMTRKGGPINLTVFERSNVYPMWSSPDEPAMEADDLIEKISKELEPADSLLCILNKKASVSLIHEKLTERFPEFEIVYLTTNLCAAHRLQKIDKIKEFLKQKRAGSFPDKKLICVTTSLIEAGVDLDFDIVCRSIAGADSIEQAQGRCNREGLLELGGKVYVFRLKEDNTNVKGLRDIYKRGQITMSFINRAKQINLKEDQPIKMRDLTENFYAKYFLENSSEMVLRLPDLDTNAVDLLSTNDRNMSAVYEEAKFRKRHQLLQAFNTAARKMRLIDQDSKSIIVPYKNTELIKELLRSIDNNDMGVVKKVLRKLQRYTVNVPHWRDLSEYCEFTIEEMHIYILRTEYYDMVRGMDIKQKENEALLY